ncbi:MAG: hypothetical protein HC941_13970 [Microcoleus sp. SU_5_3]|nr:hypothetical protein [Microcoleus sp. SU_5_3]
MPFPYKSVMVTIMTFDRAIDNLEVGNALPCPLSFPRYQRLHQKGRSIIWR